MKRSNKERIARDERDSYRRSEMEFGVAADAYRSDPSRKATRNGAVMVTVVLALAAFLAVLTPSRSSWGSGCCRRSTCASNGSAR